MKILFIVLICIFAISVIYNLYEYGVALKREQAEKRSNRFLERRVNRSLFLVTTMLAFIAVILELWARFL
jgi:uncharacterized membrane protein